MKTLGFDITKGSHDFSVCKFYDIKYQITSIEFFPLYPNNFSIKFNKWGKWNSTHYKYSTNIDRNKPHKYRSSILIDPSILSFYRDGLSNVTITTTTYGYFIIKYYRDNSKNPIQEARDQVIKKGKEKHYQKFLPKNSENYYILDYNILKNYHFHWDDEEHLQLFTEYQQTQTYENIKEICAPHPGSNSLITGIEVENNHSTTLLCEIETLNNVIGTLSIKLGKHFYPLIIPHLVYQNIMLIFSETIDSLTFQKIECPNHINFTKSNLLIIQLHKMFRVKGGMMAQIQQS